MRLTMGESIGMDIEIGGSLPARLIDSLLDQVQEEIHDISGGPTTKKKLLKWPGATVKWFGTSNYGECNELKCFLESYKIGYIHHCCASDEYNASITYWTPGKKYVDSIASQEGKSLVAVDAVKPICDLMLAIIKDGPKALPLFIGNASVEKIVEEGLRNPKKLYNILKKEIDSFLPTIPDLPDFRVV
jgi:hypothetical protein